MEKYYIEEFQIANANPFTKTFRVPIEHKVIKGVFAVYDSSNVKFRMGVNIGGTEIITKQFDPTLIKFNGFLNRKELTYGMNVLNRNQNVDVAVKVTDGNVFPLTVSLYFLVE